MRTVLDFQSFLIIQITQNIRITLITLSIRNYQSLSAHR